MNGQWQSVVYQVGLLAVFMAAAMDFIREPHVRRLSKSYRKPLGWWFAAQGAGIIALLLSGNAGRAGNAAFYYLAASMMLALVLPAGTTAQIRAAGKTPRLFPILPLLRNSAQRPRRYWLWAASLYGATAAVTLAVFFAADWSPHEGLQQKLALREHAAFANIVFAAYLLISAAFVEELVLRHYLVPRIATLLPNASATVVRTAIAIVLTAAFFSLGHSAMVEPQWLKFTQVFLLGLIFGTGQAVLGTEAAVLLHLAFNATATAIGPLLR